MRRILRAISSSLQLPTGAAVLALAAAGAACGGEAAARDLAVTLDEWEVRPASEEVTSGRYRIAVTNDGRSEHELVVVKSDLPPGELAVTGGKVDEAQLNLAGRVAPVAPGASATLELRLSPGKYVLLCNLVEAGESHYAAGMYAGLFVTP